MYLYIMLTAANAVLFIVLALWHSELNTTEKHLSYFKFSLEEHRKQINNYHQLVQLGEKQLLDSWEINKEYFNSLKLYHDELNSMAKQFGIIMVEQPHTPKSPKLSLVKDAQCNSNTSNQQPEPPRSA